MSVIFLSDLVSFLCSNARCVLTLAEDLAALDTEKRTILNFTYDLKTLKAHVGHTLFLP